MKKRVLVIDDDGDFRSSVSALLESEGFEVFEAPTGHEGLDRLEEVHPDLVIVDVMMETSSEGYGVNQAIKYQPRYKAFENVPVIMISSIQESPDQLFFRAGNVGMVQPDRYLTKPLDIPRFLETVRQVAPRA